MRGIFEALLSVCMSQMTLPPRRKGRNADHPLTFRLAFPLRRFWPGLLLHAGVILSE